MKVVGVGRVVVVAGVIYGLQTREAVSAKATVGTSESVATSAPAPAPAGVSVPAAEGRPAPVPASASDSRSASNPQEDPLDKSFGDLDEARIRFEKNPASTSIPTIRRTRSASFGLRPSRSRPHPTTFCSP